MMKPPAVRKTILVDYFRCPLCCFVIAYVLPTFMLNICIAAYCFVPFCFYESLSWHESKRMHLVTYQLYIHDTYLRCVDNLFDSSPFDSSPAVIHTNTHDRFCVGSRTTNRRRCDFMLEKWNTHKNWRR